MFARTRHAGDASSHSPDSSTDNVKKVQSARYQPSQAQIKRATRTRLIWSLTTSFLLLLSVVFLILVQVGNTSVNDSVRNSIYFIRLDLTNIIPQSVPNSFLVNTIARTLGLHDFYQVGLWNFCEGYNNEGVTRCSTPRVRYWFNPVEIILNELLAGATIALPTDVTDILNTIQMASHWMFGLFLAGICLAFVMIFLNPLAVFSRWVALFTSVFTTLAALFVTAASVIATVMFVIMRNAFTSVADLNITSAIGGKMFAFMWIASGCALFAAIIQAGECCCCASRRDVKKGKKRGSEKAWPQGDRSTKSVTATSKPARRWYDPRRRRRASQSHNDLHES